MTNKAPVATNGKGAPADGVPIRIPPLPKEQWTDAARAVFAFWSEPEAWENGSKTNSQMVLAQHPALGMAYNVLGRHLLIDSSAPAWVRELGTLRVAWHMRSDYEWHYHVGYALNLGMTLDQIAAVRVGPDAGSWTAFDAAILRCVDELWSHSRVSDATWATLSTSLDTHQLMDFIVMLGQYVMLGWALAAFGVQLEAGVDRIGFDLKTASGNDPQVRFKPGEIEDWAAGQYDGSGDAPAVEPTSGPAPDTEPKPDLNVAIGHRPMTLDALLAREAIRDTLSRYTIAGDRLKVDDYVACFIEDGVIEAQHDRAEFRFRYEGRDAIRAWQSRWRTATAQGDAVHRASFARHHLSTCQIELTGPVTADVRSYWVAWTDIGPDHAGYYLDRFRRVDGLWLIAHRIVREDWRSPDSLFDAAVDRTR